MKVISRRFLFLAVLSFVGTGWLSGQVGSIEAMKLTTLFPTPNLCSCPLWAGHLPSSSRKHCSPHCTSLALWNLGSGQLCCAVSWNTTHFLSSLSSQQWLTFKQTFLLGWFSCEELYLLLCSRDWGECWRELMCFLTCGPPWVSSVFFYCLQQSRLQLGFLCCLNDWNGLKIILRLRLRM